MFWPVGHPTSTSGPDLPTTANLHAPHVLDIEFLHMLRKLVRTRDLSPDRAEDARSDFADLTIVRYPHLPLADRIWELRNNLTAYDAVFVALSEILSTPS